MVVLIKHIPQRRCVSCGTKADKSSFIRIVRKDNCFELDETYKKEGRGAYVCKNRACIEKLGKIRGFNRAYKTEVPKEIYAEILGRSRDG